MEFISEKDINSEEEENSGIKYKICDTILVNDVEIDVIYGRKIHKIHPSF